MIVAFFQLKRDPFLPVLGIVAEDATVRAKGSGFTGITIDLTVEEMRTK